MNHGAMWIDYWQRVAILHPSPSMGFLWSHCPWRWRANQHGNINQMTVKRPWFFQYFQYFLPSSIINQIGNFQSFCASGFVPPFLGGCHFFCAKALCQTQNPVVQHSKGNPNTPSRTPLLDHVTLENEFLDRKKAEKSPLRYKSWRCCSKKNEKSRSNESNRVLAALEGTLWPSGRHLLQQASSRLKLQKWSTRFFHHNNFPKRYFCTKFLRLGLWHCHLHMSKVESRV